MAERDAQYRGVEIIVDIATQPDGTWTAVFTLYEGATRIPFTVDPLQGTTEDAVVEAAIDQAQREIDKMLLYRGIANEPGAEQLLHRKKPD